MDQVRLPGIIGGLGPAAHVEFEKRLLSQGHMRGARRDQDYIAWVLVSATWTPERTDALLADDTQAAVTALADAARRLLAAGADFAAVPCNTAHALRDAVTARVPLPWLDLIDVTCAKLAKRYPEGSRILVLETTGTMQTGLYRKRLEAVDLVAVEFDADSSEQHDVMRAIFDEEFGIKATGTRVDPRARALVQQVLERSSHSIACAVTGCTELSIAFEDVMEDLVPIIDPLNVLAVSTYDAAFGLRPLPPLAATARR